MVFNFLINHPNLREALAVLKTSANSELVAEMAGNEGVSFTLAISLLNLPKVLGLDSAA